MGSRFGLVVRAGQSLGQLIVAGHYDVVDQDLLSSEFVAWRSRASHGEARLVAPRGILTTNEALELLRKKRLRPPNLEELLTYGAAFPEATPRQTVVGLGWFWSCLGGVRHAACIINGRRRRRLILEPTDGVWVERDLFLAIRD